MKKIIQSLLICGLLSSSHLIADEYRVIQIYSQDELNVLVKNNQHLQQVKKDDCQLIEDIEAHALKVKEPTYVYLWGDMLAWGVCVDRNVELGMFYIHEAAQQGLLAAIEQLGRYYNKGILVIEDKDRAITYLREAALQGHTKAQLSYIALLNEGYGSPYDYEEAYRALHNSVIASPKMKQQANQALVSLAQKMPEYAVRKARGNYTY
ncbi:flagellar protein MotX [Psychromonas sp.]|nr:flagellar protein MotX [Psychromonas sp.]